MAWISFVHCNKYVYSIKYLWRAQEQAIGYQHIGEGLGDKRTTARAMVWHGCDSPQLSGTCLFPVTAQALPQWTQIWEQGANHIMGYWSRAAPWLLESTAHLTAVTPTPTGKEDILWEQNLSAEQGSTDTGTGSYASAPQISRTEQHGPHGTRASGAESQVQENIEHHHCTGSCGCPACGFISSRKAA